MMKREKIIGFKVTQKEYEKVLKLAIKSGVNVSDYCRYKVLNRRLPVRLNQKIKFYNVNE